MAEKWEYKVVDSSCPLAPSELDVWGDEGWELVSHAVVPTGRKRSDLVDRCRHIYTFKRPKKQEA